MTFKRLIDEKVAKYCGKAHKLWRAEVQRQPLWPERSAVCLPSASHLPTTWKKKKIDGEKKFGSDIQPHSSPLPTERPSPNPLDPSWTSLTCCVSLSRHQTGAPARRSEARRLMFSQREHEWGREMRRPRPPASTSASFKHRHDPPSRPTLLSLPPPSNCVQKSADWLRRLLLLGKEEWINRWIEK